MNDIKDDRFTPPKEDIWDVSYKLTKAALSVAPPFAEFYQVVIKPPFQKRMLNWMEIIAEECKKNETIRDDFKPENLINNDIFQSAFAQCSRIAVQTHQKQKIEALKNALLNTVIMIDLEENSKFLFVNYIDSMTSLHLSILEHFAITRKGNISLDGIYSNYIPEYLSINKNLVKIEENLFTQICKDLELKNLIIKGKSPRKERRTLTDAWDWIGITNDGKNFLDFIRT